MDIVERLRVRWEKMDGAAARKISVILKDRADAATEIERLRYLLSQYVADETRFNRGDGEPYGSISTEVGIQARSAVLALWAHELTGEGPTMIDEALVAKVIAQIEGQNWTDQPLTEHDRNLIALAVAVTATLLKQQ